MRIIFGFLLIALFTNPYAVLCQTISPHVDIITCFDLREEQTDLIDKISQQFVKELEIKAKGRRLSINIYKDSREDFEFWLDSLSSRFYTIIEISTSRWMVDRSLKIPFVFNIYRNNFKLEAFVKLYRRGINIPILINSFNVKVNGPRVYQLLRNDPHDGSLIISNSRRILYEEQAIKKIIRQVSNEVYDSMKEYGG